MSTGMTPDRARAILAMRIMGWEPHRRTAKGSSHPTLRFTRQSVSGDGVVHSVAVRQDRLSLGWVARTALAYGDAPALQDKITALCTEWFETRFASLYGPAPAVSQPTATVQAAKVRALDMLDKLQGRGKHANPSNPCWGDGAFAASIQKEFGVNDLGALRRWAEGGL